MKNKRFYLIILVLLLLLVYFYQKSHVLTDKNNIPSQPKPQGLCTRTTPYENPPELERAMSLVSERWNATSNATGAKGPAKNCLHVIYKRHSEMEDTEGYFSFDKNSDPNDIRIYVDDTYKNYDDILTASLLKHELIHVALYRLALEGTSLPTCIENEVSAFYGQLVFLSNLNEEEWKSITYRVWANPNLNSAYRITYYLFTLNEKTSNACGDDSKCFTNYSKDSLRKWVSSNPFYQKQCGL